MGRKSTHKSASRRSTVNATRQLTGLPPTLDSVQTLQRYANRQNNLEAEVNTLHPDFDDVDKAQMAFDQAVFKKVKGITLIRHPYPSEVDLKAIYEEENGLGSSTGLLLMLAVKCWLPNQSHARSKEPTALGPRDPLFQKLSQGYCVILGEHGTSSMFYGLLHQRLPIEIIETGVMPL